MSVPRFHGRRDFVVATAGWFSVLKTAPRMVKLRAPAYRALSGPSNSEQTSTETPAQLADRLSTIKIPLVGDSGMIDRGLVRMALIVLSAASFTYFILWWMMHARP